MNCYPEMNGKIVHLLELREDAISLYAARRIQDLEQEISKGRAVLEHKLREAEEKAWASLGRYKFWMAGYWVAVWIHLANVARTAEPAGPRRRNPFRALVRMARHRAQMAEIEEISCGERG